MVIGWFRPPMDQALPTNGTRVLSTLHLSTPQLCTLTDILQDLERYNVRVDGWGLATIAIMLLLFLDAVPNPLLSTSPKSDPASTRVKQRYARAAIMADVFHHVMTGIGAWNHYAKDTHYNMSMGVGVWGCTGLAVLGVATLVAPAWISGLGQDVQTSELKVKAK